ncbi:site-specific integrase [Crenalkalicoccus roseus]|uniref:hypothetical protein n=1 Tax=Crenalkalicoccus roseus TaxID=1485588 RepID=UPI0010812990|nr:hypothetical protein [Crenalkalicoccus roseus]
MLRFLMLTLARREEVTAMTWSEVAPDLSTWTLPAGRSKNCKLHVVHLAAPARAELRAPAAAEAGAEPPEPILGWVVHDFRRTGVTVLAERGSPACRGSAAQTRPGDHPRRRGHLPARRVSGGAPPRSRPVGRAHPRLRR